MSVIACTDVMNEIFLEKVFGPNSEQKSLVGLKFDQLKLAIVERSLEGIVTNLPPSSPDTVLQTAKQAFDAVSVNSCLTYQIAILSDEGEETTSEYIFDFDVRRFGVGAESFVVTTILGDSSLIGNVMAQKSTWKVYNSPDRIKLNRAISPDYLRQHRLLSRMKDSIVDLVDMPVVVSSVDGSVTLANTCMREFLGPGLSFDGSRRFSWFKDVELWDDKFIRKLDKNEYLFDELCIHGTPFTFRFGKYMSPTEPRVFEVTGQPIYSEELENPERIGGIAVARDVTYWYKQAEESTRKTETLLENVFNALPQYVWVIEPPHKIIYLSPNMTDYGLTLDTGYEEFFGNIHPEDRESVERLHRVELPLGHELKYQTRVREVDGNYRWLTNRVVPLLDDDGVLYRTVGTSTDVTDEVAKLFAARRLREHLQCLVMNSDTSIWSVDESFKVTMSEGMQNSTLGQLLVVGVNAETATATSPAFCGPIRQVLKGEVVTVSSEVAVDGQWIRTRYMPIYKRKMSKKFIQEESDIEFDTSVVVGVIGVSSDITNRKLANLALEARTREVTMLQQKESAMLAESQMKTQFMATMSHEIRTPIAGVVGLAELLRVTNLDSEQREYLDNILFSANKLLDLVRDVLDFSKVEAGFMHIYAAPFNLKKLLADTCKSAVMDAKNRNLKFISDIALDEIGPEVTGDAGRLNQILSNLIHNSLKFTPLGHVKLLVEVDDRKSSEQNEKFIKFTVQDTGIGIRASTLPEIFKPFKQEDASVARGHEGTGLGLAICKRLVELMGGEINITSKYGDSTTVWFTIPLKVNVAGTTAMSVHPKDADLEIKCKPKKDRQSTRILVVEDNLINQQIAKKTLRKMGFSVLTALNGKECLDFMKHNAAPDLILMDCQMPVIDGYTATAMLRQHPDSSVRSVPIVAMTASVIAGDREKCLASGMDDYLAKPYSLRELESMIVRWLIENETRLASLSADNSFSLQQIKRDRSRSVSEESAGKYALYGPSYSMLGPVTAGQQLSPLDSLSPASETGSSSLNDGLISTLQFVEMNGYVANAPALPVVLSSDSPGPQNSHNGNI
ncbi:hypothetical protein V1512DRAFT_248683 [Lipomyces arxii]|uniref:uncharacterized protein n=1 Tax=Lipomyces arxii TaxID=56418 RepID=UPI0034CFC4ED